MMVRCTALLLGLAPLLFVGCARAPAGPSRGWISRQGGLLDGEASWRPQALLAQLATTDLPVGLSVHVLASRELAAYSWPDGSLFVTSGLLARLDDAELCAALSHEIGHLLADRKGGAPPPAGLSGSLSDEKEQRADAIGVALLKRQQLPEEAMISMLKKVAAGESPGSPCQRAMTRRINQLQCNSASSTGLHTEQDLDGKK
jgi:Zn-dependent protease with chaperone function